MELYVSIVEFVVPLGLLLFWFWMFWHMMNNPDLSSGTQIQFKLPLTSKFEWLIVFFVLNVFGAVFYYFAEYRNRR